jgi:uncharacterized protein YggE
MKTVDRILIVIVALLLCAATIYAFKPHSNLEGREGISVNGEAIAQVQPDTLTLNFSVQEKADTSLEAQTKIDEISKSFIELIKDLGVDSKQIQTSNYSVYANYYWEDGTSRRVQDGYNASQNITVTLYGDGFIERGQKVLSAAPTVGNIIINNSSFSLKDKSAGQAEVRALAVEAAYNKAKQLADAAGVTLGDPISIAESSSGGDYYPIMYNAKAVMDTENQAAYDSAGLEAGTSEVKVRVDIMYKIK